MVPVRLTTADFDCEMLHDGTLCETPECTEGAKSDTGAKAGRTRRAGRALAALQVPAPEPDEIPVLESTDSFVSVDSLDFIDGCDLESIESVDSIESMF